MLPEQANKAPPTDALVFSGVELGSGCLTSAPRSVRSKPRTAIRSPEAWGGAEASVSEEPGAAAVGQLAVLPRWPPAKQVGAVQSFSILRRSSNE
jgi:hypothetical protein